MAEPRIQARGLTRVFGGGAGVTGLDLDVAAGEIHALVGLNGAGKTTLMRLLLGMPRSAVAAARLQPANTGLTEWEHDPERARWTLHSFNETSHLFALIRGSVGNEPG